MADAWDDDGSDDAWDVDSDEGDAELEARLGKLNSASSSAPPKFDDEEDLAVKEKAEAEARSNATLRTKGKALAAKKAAEAERKEEEELARRAMELDLEMEESMTAEERKIRERQRIEDADHALTNDLFGGVDDGPRGAAGGGGVVVAKTAAGDTVVMVDMKDHLKHAKKVGQCIRAHGKVHLASAFLKEAIKECKDVLDDDAVSDLIKTLNVIKNEKVAAAKRKVKGQAQKSKRDKAAEAKAKKIQEELYGDSNKYDDYDAFGEAYEDDFF